MYVVECLSISDVSLDTKLVDKRRAEIWTERGHERVRYTVLPDPSISFIFIICKRMRECNGAKRVSF